MATELPKTIHDVETPCFLVDIDVVKRNCQRMIDRCQKLGVELRPHMKTHKTREAGELMTNGTKRKIVVSTLAEAIFFADNGFEDILWGSPLVKERISKRMIDLANRLEEFHVMVDSEQGIDDLIATPLQSGNKWSVFLEVDCGYGRTGCVWNTDLAIQIAKKAVSSPNTEFQGIYTHCGNSYCPDESMKNQIQTQTAERLLALKGRLSENGIECKSFGCGSTPTCSKPVDGLAALTELHPGNYVFYDYMQVLCGSCTFEDIACRVLTTVISHKPEVQTLVVDCGWTAISLDAPRAELIPATSTFLGQAPVQGHPELRMYSMTQELGKLKAAQGEIDYSKYPLGSRLFLYPYHSCATACMHPVYYVHSGDTIVDVWKPVRGW